MRHVERHRSERIGWLRAAVMGADDGIVSTASLVLGIAGAGAARGNVMVAGGTGATTGAVRVTFWGALAKAITYGVGCLFGAVVQAAPAWRRDHPVTG